MTKIKNVVTEVETNYPETTKMFKEVMQEQYELFIDVGNIGDIVSVLLHPKRQRKFPGQIFTRTA